MSFKKRATKSIALALVGVTIATPMLNTASAMEDVNINQITSRQIIDNSNREPIESTPTNNDEETNYDEVQIDKYFYNQSEPEAEIM